MQVDGLLPEDAAAADDAAMLAPTPAAAPRSSAAGAATAAAAAAASASAPALPLFYATWVDRQQMQPDELLWHVLFRLGTDGFRNSNVTLPAILDQPNLRTKDLQQMALWKRIAAIFDAGTGSTTTWEQHSKYHCGLTDLRRRGPCWTTGKGARRWHLQPDIMAAAEDRLKARLLPALQAQDHGVQPDAAALQEAASDAVRLLDREIFSTLCPKQRTKMLVVGQAMMYACLLPRPVHHCLNQDDKWLA
jgi:hypothetical protein